MKNSRIEELHRTMEPLAAANVNRARFSIQTIKPDDAKRMLERRRPSHAIQQTAVKAYTEAMANDAWVLNGMPIIFGEDGTLLDGVQRLEACAKSDKEFQTVIAENIREDTLHTIDQHRRRSYTGVLEARGEQHAGALMRTMSKLIRYENGRLGMPDSQISWMRYDRVLDENPVLREAVALSTERGSTALRSTARHCVVFMALAAGHRKEIGRFLEALRRPEDFPHGEPAVVLATQLNIAHQQKTPFPVDTAMAMAIMAFNDTLHGRRRNAYLWEPDYGKAELDREGRPVNRRNLKEIAPANLGMPKIHGYPGLKGAIYETAEFTGPLVETWRHGAPRDKEEEQGEEKEKDGNKELHIRAVTIEPETAREWLNRFNLGNRKILQSHVETIARDIKRGDWMFNAQPICFSNTGRLLNGQHRLRACALAGEPIDVIIVTGLPDEAFATYDIHARKTAATDMISGDVRADMRVVAAAAKLQWAMEQEEAGIIVTSSPSATEIRRTIEAHPGLIEAYPRARRMADIASAGIMNFVVYRTRVERPDLAEDFLDGLETGAGLEKKNPILKTRNMLLVERNAPGAYRRKRFLAEILECWEDYKLWRDDPGSARKKRRSTRADKESQALLFAEEDG